MDICPSPTYPKRDVIRALVPTQMRRGMRGCAHQVIAEQEAHTTQTPWQRPHIHDQENDVGSIPARSSENHLSDNTAGGGFASLNMTVLAIHPTSDVRSPPVR